MMTCRRYHPAFRNQNVSLLRNKGEIAHKKSKSMAARKPLNKNIKLGRRTGVIEIAIDTVTQKCRQWAKENCERKREND